MKIVNIALAILFALFAFWQVNDPDPWLWVSIYLFTAIIFAAAAFKKYNIYVVYFGIAFCIIGIGLLFPELISWIKMGSPDIAETMKTDKPYIEFVREFFGLIIILFALLFHYFSTHRKTTPFIHKRDKV